MKSILITGASGNMGQAMVRKFLSAGYTVTGTLAPHDTTPLPFQDPAFRTVTADLMDETAAGQLISELVKKTGLPDVAVLTVGGFAMGDIEGTPSADIRKQIALNFETAYHVARPLFVEMKKRGHGKIFLVGSGSGADMRNGKGMTAYALAKSLVFRLAELMNEEARGTDVITMVIVPSTIDTPQNRAAMPDADFSKWIRPEAIADAVYSYSTDVSAALRKPVLKF